MNLFRPYPIALFALLATTLLAGCEMEQRVVTRNPWVEMFEGSEWYDGPARDSNGDASTSRNDRGYAVELGRYSGAEAFHGAHRIMQRARQDAGLANLWHTTQNNETTVYMGRFRDDDSRDARTALRQARDAKAQGQALFPDAKLVKLNAARGEVLDPRDLRTLTGRGLYSLQIGHYDGSFGPDFRRAAETAVDVLRDQGEDAYYYHGPHRSHVLINAWTYAEAFTRAGQHDTYSNAVRITQDKHPHNIPNGQPFGPGDDPDYVASQRSFLVPIR